ncbi:hypothetical protein VTI28DRAFT_10194 [Corynascus sepedonium]
MPQHLAFFVLGYASTPLCVNSSFTSSCPLTLASLVRAVENLEDSEPGQSGPDHRTMQPGLRPHTRVVDHGCNFNADAAESEWPAVARAARCGCGRMRDVTRWLSGTQRSCSPASCPCISKLSITFLAAGDATVAHWCHCQKKVTGYIGDMIHHRYPIGE